MRRARRLASVLFAPVVASAFALGYAGCGGDAAKDAPAGTPVFPGGTTPAPPPDAPPGSRSCDGRIGADSLCGGVPNDDQAPGNQSCCDARAVPGGTFNRFGDPRYPALVSDFALDTFLLTAGRFRVFVDAMNGDIRGNAPAPGAGQHPRIPGSGWRPEWNQFLPSSRAEVDLMLGPEESDQGFMGCQMGTDIDGYGALTWWTPALEARVKDRNSGRADVLAENTREALDRKPINCIPWHVLFAFCIWDGGRLPTEAEFDFASSGGAEQRGFPWGEVPGTSLAPIGKRPTSALAPKPVFAYGQQYVIARLWDARIGDGSNSFEDNYGFTYGGNLMAPTDNALHIAPVGRKPLGNGKWGHADLAGNMFEWMLDEGPIRPGACNDCANIDWPAPGQRDPNAEVRNDIYSKPMNGRDWWAGGVRAVRGSAWDNALALSNRQPQNEIEAYTSYPLLRTYRALGGRCARDL